MNFKILKKRLIPLHFHYKVDYLDESQNGLFRSIFTFDLSVLSHFHCFVSLLRTTHLLFLSQVATFMVCKSFNICQTLAVSKVVYFCMLRLFQCFLLVSCRRLIVGRKKQTRLHRFLFRVKTFRLLRFTYCFRLLVVNVNRGRAPVGEYFIKTGKTAESGLTVELNVATGATVRRIRSSELRYRSRFGCGYTQHRRTIFIKCENSFSKMIRRLRCSTLWLRWRIFLLLINTYTGWHNEWNGRSHTLAH